MVWTREGREERRGKTSYDYGDKKDLTTPTQNTTSLRLNLSGALLPARRFRAPRARRLHTSSRRNLLRLSGGGRLLCFSGGGCRGGGFLGGGFGGSGLGSEDGLVTRRERD